ncbi:hypothetical protein EST38_g4800, partial [Candolleomyces aberdarensis]
AADLASVPVMEPTANLAPTPVALPTANLAPAPVALPIANPAPSTKGKKSLETEQVGIPEDEFEKLLDALDEDAAAADADAMNIDNDEIVEIPAAVIRRHFPDVWEKLSEDQRRRLIERGKKAWERFLKSNHPLGEQIRCWARRHADFLPIAGTHSLLMAASLFILGNGRTVCHYHTIYDRGQEPINDAFPGNRNKKLNIKVTGIPFEPLEAHLKTFDTLLPSPDAAPKRGAKNPNFNLKNVLAFFPMKDGNRILHCGCELEPALLDLFIWKTMKIRSIRSKKSERLGRPMKPRDRLFLYHTLDHFCVDVRMMYSFDVKGNPLNFVDERKQHIRELLQSLKEYEADARKEEEEARAAAKRQEKAFYEDVADVLEISSDDDSDSD